MVCWAAMRYLSLVAFFCFLMPFLQEVQCSCEKQSLVKCWAATSFLNLVKFLPLLALRMANSCLNLVTVLPTGPVSPRRYIEPEHTHHTHLPIG